MEAAEDFLKNRVANEMELDKWAVQGVVDCVIASSKSQDAIQLLTDVLGNEGKARDVYNQYEKLKREPDDPSSTLPPSKSTSAATVEIQANTVVEACKTKPKGEDNIKSSRRGKGEHQRGQGWDLTHEAAKARAKGPSFVAPGRQLCACQAVDHALLGNCLACGKIVCAQEGLGPCLYCGAEFQGKLGSRAPAKTADAAPKAGASSAQGARSDQSEADMSTPAAPADVATAKAVEAKNRLVLFDRTSAQRTTVIDDQSDYFAIDTNQWLSEEERRDLMQQEAEEKRAEEEKKKRVTVSFDLVGRKVVMEGTSEEKQSEQERAAAAAKAADEAALLTMREFNEGGGRAAPAARALAASKRVEVDPRIKGAAPIFRPSTRQPEGGGDPPSARAHSALAGAGAADRVAADGRRTDPDKRKQAMGLVKAHNRRQAAHPAAKSASRLQHDDVFDVDLGEASARTESSHYNPADPKAEGAAWLAAMAAKGSAHAACAAQSPFHLCGAEHEGGHRVVAPRPAPRLATTSSPQKRVLLDGLVLLKGWLDTAAQIEVVKLVSDLGKGPGGFYVPKYSDDARLALNMMCLGHHWDPNTGAYHALRELDGSTPPDIPPSVKQLAMDGLDAASAAATAEGASPLPKMCPDICLVNFYSQGGKLGMHQDKSESRDSLRRGAPVVSISIGDAADFHYSMTDRLDLSSKVVLESGDLLVFGGPARLVYHGISNIYNNTAPKQLVEATKLRPGRLNMTFREFR